MLSSSKLSLAAFCGGVQNNTAAYGNVADGDVITLGESEIKVIATPGHTKGGVCYVCDNNVFTGDTMFFAPAEELIFRAAHHRKSCKA